jgi:hypothetical protein
MKGHKELSAFKNRRVTPALLSQRTTAVSLLKIWAYDRLPLYRAVCRELGESRKQPRVLCAPFQHMSRCLFWAAQHSGFAGPMAFMEKGCVS